MTAQPPTKSAYCVSPVGVLLNANGARTDSIWRAANVLFSAAIALAVAGCSGTGPTGLQASADAQTPPDVAVRSAPVVPGRPARVFVFAGLGDNCEPLPAPEIRITAAPAKGDVKFVPGQQTTIQYSAKGTCVGKMATGTGVYYTARSGAEGSDSFSVTAQSSGSETSRTFEVAIAQ